MPQVSVQQVLADLGQRGVPYYELIRHKNGNVTIVTRYGKSVWKPKKKTTRGRKDPAG